MDAPAPAPPRLRLGGLENRTPSALPSVAILTGWCWQKLLLFICNHNLRALSIFSEGIWTFLAPTSAPLSDKVRSPTGKNRYCNREEREREFFYYTPDTTHGTAIYGAPLIPPGTTTPTDRQSYGSPRQVVFGLYCRHFSKIARVLGGSLDVVGLRHPGLELCGRRLAMGRGNGVTGGTLPGPSKDGSGIHPPCL